MCSATWRQRCAKSRAREHARKLSGKEEALLVATACSKPPAGRARWTLVLLAGELVKLTEHDGVSREMGRAYPEPASAREPWSKES